MSVDENDSVPASASVLPQTEKQEGINQDSINPAFVFHSLRQISSLLYSRKSTRQLPSTVKGLKIRPAFVDEIDGVALGSPTVLDVRGMIAIGTTNGWVAVFGFDQELRCVLGNQDLGTCRPWLKLMEY
jgi:hypothetical protein